MTETLVALIAGLAAGDASKRASSAEALARLGEAAQPAAVALAKASGDADETTREWATAALEGLGAPRAEDVAALSPLLKDKSLDVAYWAATLLGRLRAGAAQAVPALAAVVQDGKELPVCQRAAWALGEIGHPEGARPVLESAAKSSDPRLARLANEALEKLR